MILKSLHLDCGSLRRPLWTCPPTQVVCERLPARVFLASAAMTVLTKSVDVWVPSGLRSHWSGHSQEARLRQIGSLSAKSQIYSSPQEGVSSTELDCFFNVHESTMNCTVVKMIVDNMRRITSAKTLDTDNMERTTDKLRGRIGMDKSQKRLILMSNDNWLMTWDQYARSTIFANYH